MSTYCDHGIPLDRKCGACRVLLGWRRKRNGAAKNLSPQIVVEIDSDEALFRECRAIRGVAEARYSISLGPDQIGAVVVVDRSDRLSITASDRCGEARLG